MATYKDARWICSGDLNLWRWKVFCSPSFAVSLNVGVGHVFEVMGSLVMEDASCLQIHSVESA
jgi:hypothetical protein